MLDGVLDAARRAPSAGNSQGWDFVVLEGPDTARFWDVTLPADRRATFRWPQLLDAPVIVLPLADRQAYLAATPSPTRRPPGSPWPTTGRCPTGRSTPPSPRCSCCWRPRTPGSGALFFGVFRGAERLLADLGVPPATTSSVPWPSATRSPTSPDARPTAPGAASTTIVHRGGWDDDRAAPD